LVSKCGAIEGRERSGGMDTVDVKIDVLLWEGRGIEVRWYLMIVVKKHREKRVEHKVISHLDYLSSVGLLSRVVCLLDTNFKHG
jgi:hypothetical protein